MAVKRNVTITPKECRAETIPTHEFENLPDNPIQRDTAKHAEYAVKRHLRTACETHRSVTAAEMNGRLICKIDGHTRCLLWRDGRLARPDTVLVTIYPISSMDEAGSLYKCHDNSCATEKVADKVAGAMRAAGIVAESPIFRYCDFSTALRCAVSGGSSGLGDEYTLVAAFRDAIIEVDSWNLSKTKFKGSGLVALMLLAVASRVHVVETVREFFTRYANGEGNKSGRLKDGVQALSDHMEQRRTDGTMTGFENIRDMMSKGLSCLDAWCAGKNITSVQPSNEALKAMQVKAIKNINLSRALSNGSH